MNFSKKLMSDGTAGAGFNVRAGSGLSDGLKLRKSLAIKGIKHQVRGLS